jgi:hypothetical protein
MRVEEWLRMGVVKFVSLFAFYYAIAWLGWFTLLSPTCLHLLSDHAVRELSGDPPSVSFLIQILSVTTAIISTFIFIVVRRRRWRLGLGPWPRRQRQQADRTQR